MVRKFLENSIKRKKNGVIIGEDHSTHACILAINDALPVLEKLSKTKPVAVVCEIPSPRSHELKEEALNSWSDKLAHCPHFNDAHKAVLHIIARMGIQIYGFETSYSNPFMNVETIDEISSVLDDLNLSQIKDACFEAELDFEDFLLTAQAAYSKTDARLIRPNEEVESIVQKLGKETFTILLVGAQHIPSLSKNKTVIEIGILNRLNRFANYDATFATPDKCNAPYVSMGKRNEEYGPIHHVSQMIPSLTRSSTIQPAPLTDEPVRTAANNASFWSKNRKFVAVGTGVVAAGIAVTLCMTSKKQKHSTF